MLVNPPGDPLTCLRRLTDTRESPCAFNFPADLGGRQNRAWRDFIANREGTEVRDPVLVALISLPVTATGAKITWRLEPSERRRKGDLTKCPLSSPTTRNAAYAYATRPRAIAGFCRAPRERFSPFGT